MLAPVGLLACDKYISTRRGEPLTSGGLTRATGYTKVMNFGSNLSSLAFFLWAGQVLYWAGLVMGLGQFIGARIGAQMVVHRGTRFIRPIFISVVLALAIKLLLAAHRIPGG